jgi:hypothetical protein
LYSLSLILNRTSPTTPLIYGNILHETLQALLQTLPFPTRSTFSPKNIKQVLGKILQDESVRNDIFKLGVGMEDVRYDVEKKAMEAFGVEDGGLAEKWCGVGEHGEIDVSFLRLPFLALCAMGTRRTGLTLEISLPSVSRSQ